MNFRLLLPGISMRHTSLSREKHIGCRTVNISGGHLVHMPHVKIIDTLRCLHGVTVTFMIPWLEFCFRQSPTQASRDISPARRGGPKET
jgi:hypothetical protein